MKIVAVDAMAMFVVQTFELGRARRRAERAPAREYDHVQRTEPEEHDRMPVEPVLQLADPRERLVLRDGEGRDVPRPAPLVVARGGMMDRMVATPLQEGREGQHPGDEPDGVVHLRPREEAPVRAIMHDDERPDEEPGDHEDEKRRRPRRHRHQLVADDQRHDEQPEGVRELPEGAGPVGPGVARDDGAPLKAIKAT